MTCEVFHIPGGGAAIVCSSRKRARCRCGSPAPLLCDWKVPGRRSGTCDTPICRSCATSPTPSKDLCPEHAQAFAAWNAAQAERRSPDGPSDPALPGA